MRLWPNKMKPTHNRNKHTTTWHPNYPYTTNHNPGDQMHCITTLTLTILDAAILGFAALGATLTASVTIGWLYSHTTTARKAQQ